MDIDQKFLGALNAPARELARSSRSLEATVRRAMAERITAGASDRSRSLRSIRRVAKATLRAARLVGFEEDAAVRGVLQGVASGARRTGIPVEAARAAAAAAMAGERPAARSERERRSAPERARPHHLVGSST